MTEEVVNGVRIITDENGNQKFIPIELKKVISSNINNRSWLGKIVDWFITSKITPYIKVKDITDPGKSLLDGDESDPDYSGPKGIEAGISIKF